MNLKLSSLALCCVLFFSCSNQEKKTSVNDRKSSIKLNYALIKQGEKTFLLDSLTSASVESVQYYVSPDGTPYMTFLNERGKAVYFYNQKTGKIEFITKLQSDGPMGVGKISGHYVQSLDSIFVLDQWTSKMSVVNRKGDKIATFSLRSNSAKGDLLLPTLKLSCVNPMLFKDDKIYLTGNEMGEFDSENTSNRPVLLSYDVKNRTSKYDVSYPEIYQNANWGFINFRDIFSTFNYKKNIVVISFPADHYLYAYDLVTKRKEKHYAGSKFFNDITSLNQKKAFSDKDQLYKYFGEQPSYSSLICDPFRNVYYRVAEAPLKQYNEDERETSIKKYSIVILDDNFEVIGETEIPHLSHSRLSFYVSPEGLNIRKYTKDEDHITFTTFLPSKI